MVSVAQNNNSSHKLTTIGNPTIVARAQSSVVEVSLTRTQLRFLPSNIPVQSAVTLRDLGSKIVTSTKKKAITASRTTIRKRITMVESSPILFLRLKLNYVALITRKDQSTPTLANSRKHLRVIASSERSLVKPVGHMGGRTRCAPQMNLMMPKRSTLLSITNQIVGIAERSTSISNSSTNPIDSLMAMTASLGLQSKASISHDKTLRHSHLANAT